MGYLSRKRRRLLIRDGNSITLGARIFAAIQVNCMINRTIRTTAIAAITLVFGAALYGCSSGDSASDKAAEAEAARANVEAMSREHANDTTDASPAAETPPARAVISERLPYAEINDELVYGYFVAPADMTEPLPAVIMIHEWWGLNDNIRAMADRLAAEGYVVLAVDMYGGRVATSPEAARQLMLSVVEDPDSANENIASAHEFLTVAVNAPGVASLGWCFGGGWSLNAAMLLPGHLEAAVIYYGQVTADQDRLQYITAPILGLFAAEDTGIPLASVEAFVDALEDLGLEHEVEVYPGVGHAFANPTGSNYNQQAATDAWARTLDFLERHLAVDGS